MRDLGGIKTKDGREISYKKLIRSAALTDAEEKDLAGISAVIDLRTPEEAREKPDKTYEVPYLYQPVFEGLVKGITKENRNRWVGAPDMDEIYARIVDHHYESFRTTLLTIMNHDYSTGAILWHCSEGKDRCGITTALVLEVLGVPRDQIMEDYLKTNLINLEKASKLREQVRPERGDLAAENIYRATIADPSYLEAAWEAMGDDYIHGCLGIEEQQILSFQKTVLL